jgi:class 3 adenylate cyclase
MLVIRFLTYLLGSIYQTLLVFKTCEVSCRFLGLLIGLGLICNTIHAQSVATLKSQVNEAQKTPAQVRILNQLSQALQTSNAKEAFTYSEKAEKLAKSINDQEGLGDTYAQLGNLQARYLDRPDRAYEAHEKAYRTYKQLYGSERLSKDKYYTFLNEQAIPTYQFVKEVESRKRRYKKAIQNYEKLNGEFLLDLTRLAEETKTALAEKETEVSEKQAEITEKTSQLRQTETAKRNLIIEKLAISGNLEKSEVEKLRLSDSLYDAEMSLRIQQLKLIQEEADLAKAQSKAAIAEKKDAEQKAVLNQQRGFIYTLAVGGALALLLLVVIVVALRNQKNANTLLKTQKQELVTKNEEINQQKEEILTQNESIEQQNAMLMQQKEEILAQNESIEQQNALLIQQKEEMEEQRDLLADMNESIIEQRDQSDNLLLNILPYEVAEELKTYGKAKPRFYEMTTVLFTDFKGFTQIAEKLTPEQIVQELNDAFMVFDEIIEKYDLEKIKTMGDGYMCVGGIPMENKTNPIDAVRAGLAMQDYMAKIRQERLAKGQEVWELRVGIHTGSLVAGVVGRKKFAYDVWGDTVNLASRLESSGEVGKVNISGTTYEYVKPYFNCIYRGKIRAKNKGEIDMYFVENPISLFQSLQGLSTSEG